MILLMRSIFFCAVTFDIIPWLNKRQVSLFGICVPGCEFYCFRPPKGYGNNLGPNSAKQGSSPSFLPFRKKVDRQKKIKKILTIHPSSKRWV